MPTITGKILRDGQSGNGLASSNGHKYEFSIEQHWRSDTPPKLGSSVNIEVDENGQVLSVQAVDIQSEVSQKLKDFSSKVQEDGLPVAKELTQQFSKKFVSVIGLPRIIIFFGLLISWYAFNSLVIQSSANHAIKFNFFDVLGFLNEGNFDSLGYGRSNSSGFYGFMAWVSAFLLFLPLLWKHRLAAWGAVAPLIFMLLCAVSIWLKIRSASSEAQSMAGSLGGKYASQLADQMMKAVMEAISLGFGFYLAIIFAIAGAIIAFKESR